MPKPTAMQRFSTAYKVDADGCWIWQGYLSRGYAPFTDQRKRTYAHRWSYEHFVGPIPEGLQIDHLCKKPACVNPDHLEPVTCRENLLRGNTFQAHNAAKTHCPKGHPYSGPNLYVKSNGGRVCRICSAESNRRTQALRSRDLDRYRETRECVVCGTDFRTSKYHKAKSCSKACANVLCSATKRAA